MSTQYVLSFEGLDSTSLPEVIALAAGANGDKVVSATVIASTGSVPVGTDVTNHFNTPILHIPNAGNISINGIADTIVTALYQTGGVNLSGVTVLALMETA
jgi:hypothetical protein